jgi:hypothetical protein
MACTTVYTHIGLLTSKGLAQREEWRRRMEEKEVRNEWSQYGPRTVTVPMQPTQPAPFNSVPSTLVETTNYSLRVLMFK